MWMALDRALARRANLATRKYQHLTSAASTLATTGSWAAVTLLALSWLRFGLTQRSRARHSTERAFLSVGLTYLVVEAIGRALPRVRPFARSDDMLALVAHADRRSFPSRHVASAFAMSTALARTSTQLGWSFAMIGALLGGARVAAGVHYSSDIIGGAFLGAAIGRVVRGK
jgi:undecaprenyl-diphosphatase